VDRQPSQLRGCSEFGPPKTKAGFRTIQCQESLGDAGWSLAATTPARRGWYHQHALATRSPQYGRRDVARPPPAAGCPTGRRSTTLRTYASLLISRAAQSR